VTKYIFITGGVVSSIGKGISAASLGRLLRARGLTISVLKMDPYINVDAGTMNPYQHGEVFVTEDGAETDLDLGHYERFIDIDLDSDSNITTGQIYGTVIANERKGKFNGGTVQVIPHITDEIKRLIRANADKAEADIAIVEVGGTVGDIEGLPFLEAIRQFRREIPEQDSLSIHVTLVPAVGPQREVKTKPTQHSVRELRNVGIHADILLARTKHELNDEQRNKIALFCDLRPEAVFTAMDCDEIYEIPLTLEQQGFGTRVIERLGLSTPEPDLSEWEGLVQRCKSLDGTVRIAMVGKYVETGVDTYLSVVEALKHAGVAHGRHVEVDWIPAGDLSPEEMPAALAGHDGILVPGGFGQRGIESKIEAVRYAREHKIPYFGLCLGLQCAVIEFARNVCGMKDAHSTEFDKATGHPVVALLDEQKGVTDLGGTMRLGACECYLQPETLARRCYGSDVVWERHRHRYEVNNHFRSRLGQQGLRFSGLSPNQQLVEIVELSDHPFFVATQFHPSSGRGPTKPHPLFDAFIAAAIAQQSGIDAAREKVPQDS